MQYMMQDTSCDKAQNWIRKDEWNEWVRHRGVWISRENPGKNHDKGMGKCQSPQWETHSQFESRAVQMTNAAMMGCWDDVLCWCQMKALIRILVFFIILLFQVRKEISDWCGTDANGQRVWSEGRYCWWWSKDELMKIRKTGVAKSISKIGEEWKPNVMTWDSQ